MLSNRLSKVTVAGAIALMLSGLSATAQGFSGPLSSAGHKRLVQISGQVLCTGCRLKEVRRDAKYKEYNHLYEVQLNEQQSVVIALHGISNAEWLENNTIAPLIWARGTEANLQKLGASDTVTKQVEISGVVTGANILNITGVAIQDDVERNKLVQQ